MVETDRPWKFRMSNEMLVLVASRFRVLGEPYRLRILQVLKRGAMTVGDLVESLEGNQSHVSRHLKTLYQAGIVSRRRVGVNIIYSVKDPKVFALCELAQEKRARRWMGLNPG